MLLSGFIRFVVFPQQLFFKKATEPRSGRRTLACATSRTKKNQRPIASSNAVFPKALLSQGLPKETAFVHLELILAKAVSAATLAHQEKNNTADVQRGRVSFTGFISPTHKRTEGRAPVWGSEFTSKDAAIQGGVQQKPLLT
jgi:hypothetical protein